MVPIRVAVAVIVIALIAVATWVLVFRGGDPRAELARLSDDYLSAWEQGDWQAMGALVADQPDAVAQAHEDMFGALRVTDAEFTPGDVLDAEDDTTPWQVPFDARLTLAGLGEWNYQSRLHWVETDAGWLVAWGSATLHPELRDGQSLARTRSWSERASILDHTGAPITEQRPTVEVGIEGGRVDDPDEVVAALVEHTDVSEDAVHAALEHADERPEWFIDVTVLRQADYDAVREAIHPVPGLVFREATAHLPPDDAFARHTVGVIGEVTAELLEELDGPYMVGDLVGRSGLERVFEEQLAGTPEGTVRIVDADGEEVSTLHEFAGTPGEPVATTLDISVQQAVDAAVADVEEPLGFVVLDAETAAVRAVASRPIDDLNRALAGRYPPGSTFKVVTAAALLGEGLSTTDAVPCPGEATVGGQRFRNADHAALGDISFAVAFAESCNTAFVQLADELGEEALAAAAERFGFERDYPGFPLGVAGGSYPEPADPAELASAAIGQARVLTSPIHMASVAAAIPAGRWQTPSLLAGEPTGDATEIVAAAQLADLMRLVVTEGTGVAAEVGGRDVHGKTGTAEVGEAVGSDPDPLTTHAWFAGFSGDLAFAVLVEEGGSGGEVAAPIAARFLHALDG